MPDIAAVRPVAGQPIETAWGQQVHDAIELVPKFQKGHLLVTSTGTSGEFSVTFSPAFAGEPVIIISPLHNSGGRAIVASVTAITATGFTARLERTDASALPDTWTHWAAFE
jgi:hypothetical protein